MTEKEPDTLEAVVTTLTEKELDTLKAAAKAATPGPWSDEHNYRLDRHYVNCRNGTKEICECQNWVEENIDGDANSAYIAAANPSVIIALIDELRQMRESIHYSDIKSLDEIIDY